MKFVRRPSLKPAHSILFGCVALTAVNTTANTPEPPGLFSTASGNAPAQLPEQAIDGRSHAVKVNYGQLRSGRFFVSLPDGVSFEAIRDLQQDLGDNQTAWTGHANGSPGSRVVLGTSGKAVAGTFFYQGRLFKLEPRANGTHVLSEVETSDPAPEMDPIPVTDSTAPDTSGTGDSVSPSSADGSPTIDVLVAYTPAIQSIYGTAGAEALIIQAVAETNQAYSNSGMSPRLNLVHTVLTPYTESGDMGTDLSRLRSTGDSHMDELHTLRDNYGADLVTLIEDEPQYCGIAYLMTSLSTGFASSAFSVVHRSCATGYYSFAHELGHNQGGHHDQANASGANFAYAYGYQEPFGQFRTVMAYNCSGGCARVDHFSNPDILFSGEATGTVDSADNARAIDETAPTVAAFRQQAAQNPPSAPASLSGVAAGHNAINLNWADTAADESGFNIERSDNGLDFIQVASLPADSNEFTDDSLTADTLYHYRVLAWNGAGNSGYSNVASVATDPAPPFVDQLASSDIAVAGSVSGTYQDTWSDNGVNQTIQERSSGGKPRNRYGYLEHKWVFQVQPGNIITLSADVQADTNLDTFTFAYSTDNASYIDMFAVTANSSGLQQFSLPSSLDGTVYVRVRDNVRQSGNVSSHSVQVDHILIRSETDGSTPAPAAPANLVATGAGTDRIDISWSDLSDNESGFTLERRMDGSALWEAVKTAGANASSYTDTGLQSATTYHYRVKAFNAGGSSVYSNTDSAQTDEAAGGGSITLQANGYKVKGRQRVDLTWSGTTADHVDVYRDGALLSGSVSNDGSYTDNIGSKGGGSYSYEVCEASSSNCSNVTRVAF